MRKNRTTGERLAVIEEVVLRTERKLDDHIQSIESRVSKLERAASYFRGAVAAIVLVISSGAIYLKNFFRP